MKSSLSEKESEVVMPGIETVYEDESLGQNIQKYEVAVDSALPLFKENMIVYLSPPDTKTRGNVFVKIVKYLGNHLYSIKYMDVDVDVNEVMQVHEQFLSTSAPKNESSSTVEDLTTISRIRARVLSNPAPLMSAPLMPAPLMQTPNTPPLGQDIGISASGKNATTSEFDPSTFTYRPPTPKPASMFKQILNGIQGNNKSSPSYSYFDVEDAIGERVQIDSSHQGYRKNRISNNALDILALYIKGQKLLYTEAKTYCEQQLNFLMLPAIFISCVSSIFSFLSNQFARGDLIMASLSGFSAFLLAVISYLKLDAKAQAHKTSAYKFDKLESMCEFNSGKFMFFTNDTGQLLDVVNSIEKEVKEIKETNQFILPESIRYEFTNTYSINVFLMVKKLQHTESTETENLSFTIQVLKSLYQSLPDITNPVERDIMMQRIVAKEKKRDECIFAIINCREKYFKMDDAFNEEIEKHIARSNRWFIVRFICCDWLKS